MKKMIKLALFLGIVAALSGLILGFVNSLTDPIIRGQEIEAEKANLELMYPGGEFLTVDYKDDSGVVLGVYEVSGKGYIVKATAVGYNNSNPLIVLVGISNDGKIDNVVPLQMQETSGFGSRCFEESNIKSLYLGKTNASEVDGLAGATFTSGAMKQIMTSAFEAYNAVK